MDALLGAGADPLAEDGDGHNALDAALVDLCAEAEDYPSTLRNYYEGLRGVPVPGPAEDRERFISSIRPALQQYTRRFVKQIRAASRDHAARSRTQMVRLLATLASHQWWARRSETRFP